MSIIRRAKVVAGVVLLGGGLAVLGGCGGGQNASVDPAARAATESSAKNAMVEGGKGQSSAPQPKSAKDYMEAASRKQR
jgi:hypothetical protein